MFFVRPIARDDLPAVLALSERTGHGLTTLPANRERLSARIERSLASFAGERVARRRVLRLRARRLDVGPRRRHRGDRGRGRPERALVQLPRRHDRPRVARARRLHRRADAVPRQRPHRPHRALLAVPRPGVPPREERAAAREEPPPVHRRIRRPLRAEGDRRAARQARRRRQEPVLGRTRPAFLRDGILDRRLPHRHRPEVVRRRADAAPPGVREPAARVRARGHRRSARRHAPARAMLEQEGFRYEGYVDIFDAGPTVECFRDNIHAVRRSRVLPVEVGDGDPVPDNLGRRHRLARTQSPIRILSRAARRRRPRASTVFRCCRTPRRSSASPTAISCAPSRCRRGTDDDGDTAARRGSDRQLRRHSRPDAQLLGARARQPRGGAARASGRQSARGGAAGTRQDAGARRTRLSRRRCCRRTSDPFVPRCARWASPAATPTSSRARARDAPRVLAACSSAAAMWVANAATVSPSADTADGRVHFTPANLVSHFHRSLEAPTTTRVLRAIFADTDALRGARSAARGTAVRRRGRGESHPVRARRRNARRRALRLRTRGARRNGTRPAALSGAADARSVGSDRAPPRPRPARTVFAQQNPGRDRRRRLPQRRDRRRRSGDRCSATKQAWVDQPAVLAKLAAAVGPELRTRSSFARGASASRTRSRAISSTASSFRATDGGMLLVAPGRVRARTRACAAYLDGLARERSGPIAEVAHVRSARRAWKTAAVRRACGLRVALTAARARGDRRARVPRRRAGGGSRRLDSTAITATGSRPRISATRRCSTNRAARSTSSRASCGCLRSIRFSSHRSASVTARPSRRRRRRPGHTPRACRSRAGAP